MQLEQLKQIMQDESIRIDRKMLKRKMLNLDAELITLESDLRENRNRFRELKRKVSNKH